MLLNLGGECSALHGVAHDGRILFASLTAFHAQYPTLLTAALLQLHQDVEQAASLLLFHMLGLTTLNPQALTAALLQLHQDVEQAQLAARALRRSTGNRGGVRGRCQAGWAELGGRRAW